MTRVDHVTSSNYSGNFQDGLIVRIVLMPDKRLLTVARCPTKCEVRLIYVADSREKVCSVPSPKSA